MPDPDRIILDTLQKLMDHGHGLFGDCLACRRSFDISLPALIAERGGNSGAHEAGAVPALRCRR